jgi:toxin CcdB
MARFDYFAGERAATYIVDVQSNHLEALPTRVVVPLEPPQAAIPPIRDLTPTITVGGEALVLLTPLMAAVPRRVLRRPLGDLLDQSDDIIRALSILLTGF